MSEPENSPDLKWLIQNARSIVVRNLYVEGKTIPTTRLDVLAYKGSEDEISESLVYKSRIIESSSNPSWTFSGLISGESSLENFHAKRIIIRAMCVTDGEADSLILEEIFNLGELVPLQSTGHHENFHFPLNFIFFEFDDDWYTCEKQYYKLVMTPYQGTYFQLHNSHYEHERSLRNSINVLCADVVEKEHALDDLRNHVVQKWVVVQTKQVEQQKGTSLRAAKLAELETLKRNLKLAEDKLTMLEKLEQQDIEQWKQTADLMELSKKCAELPSSNEELTRSLDVKKRSLFKAKFILEARQIKLLSELQTIYPIEQLENGEYAIRGVELPSDLSTKDDEQIASALSYVVHMLLLISKYLETPLRYQILFLGSRSMIRDPVQGNVGTLPLFRRNVEKERFERAMSWLRRDIEQLLLTRGIFYEQNRDILYNLQQLFQCEMCPKLAV